MKTNKLTIPTILVATVMIAGIFAFMPVDEAKAVHTTIQGTQFTLVDVLSLANLSTGFTCDSDTDYIVKVIVGTPTGDGVTLTVLMNTITVTMTGDIFVAADLGAVGYGGTGVSFTIAAEEDDTVVVDGTSTDDAHVSIITQSGAVASCV